jgi:hypothetical protein
MYKEYEMKNVKFLWPLKNSILKKAQKRNKTQTFYLQSFVSQQS